MCTRRK